MEQSALGLESPRRDDAHDVVDTDEEGFKLSSGGFRDVNYPDVDTQGLELGNFRLVISSGGYGQPLSLLKRSVMVQVGEKSVFTKAPERKRPSTRVVPEFPVAPYTRTRGLLDSVDIFEER